ncbi:hypothetical protein C8J57DRAFT_1303359 [Mycena rebaudengoi]|nr:hypothetical protein C8J57DRAFT_1303359 [Mycena rebaudengoi]
MSLTGRCSRCGHFSASQINSSVAPHPRDRLPGILSDIDALSAHLERLSAERDAIQAELDSIVYPVLTLPPEITGDIFVWFRCLSWGGGPISPHSAPQILAKICRRWRSIAIGTPELWSHLSLWMDPAGRSDFYAAVPAALEIWLARSGSHPLTIQFRSLEYVEEEHEEYCDSLDLIHNDVSFALGFRDYERLFGDSGTAFPMLRTLDLANMIDEPRFPEYPIDSFPALGNCPALRQISMSEEFLDSFPQHFPWAGITRYEPSQFRRNGWKVLQAAVNLEQCLLLVELGSFYHFAPAASLFITTAHVQLTSLKRLGLTCAGLLEWLTLPALQELYFFTISDEDLPIFLSFQTRSSCNITQLDVRLELDGLHNFAQFISSVPHLAEFIIRTSRTGSAPDPIFACLHRRNGYLPSLAKLIVRTWDRPRVDYQLLCDMLASRKPDDGGAGTWLKVFILQCDYHTGPRTPPPPVFLQRIEVLRGCGMEIRLH